MPSSLTVVYFFTDGSTTHYLLQFAELNTDY